MSTGKTFAQRAKYYSVNDRGSVVLFHELQQDDALCESRPFFLSFFDSRTAAPAYSPRWVEFKDPGTDPLIPNAHYEHFYQIEELANYIISVNPEAGQAFIEQFI